MKKIQLILGAFAFTLAIGAAFAAKSNTTLVSGFVQTETDCVTSISCDDSGDFACTTGTSQVYKTKSGTQCSTAMKRINP